MNAPETQNSVTKRGAEDSGQYFRYMAEFIGFSEADAEAIRQTKSVIEKHLPDIVTKFYAHLLRYPPTRRFFLKKDGSIDHDYLELRMRHLTNFWLRTAEASSMTITPLCGLRGPGAHRPRRRSQHLHRRALRHRAGGHDVSTPSARR